MSWGKVDDRLHAHPKAVRAGAQAMGLWVMCLSWVGAYETDGFVPSSQAVLLAKSLGISRPTGVCSQLVAVGLWEVVDGGFLFHDYRDCNKLKSQIQLERDATKQRVTRYRDRYKEDGNAVTNAVTRGRASPDPTRPIPRPKEIPPTPQGAPAAPGGGQGQPIESSASGESDPAPELTKRERERLRDLEWAAAFSVGVGAATGREHAVKPAHLETLRVVATTHAKGLRGAALDAWFTERATAYVRAKPQSQFEAGYSPTRFLDWLNEGAPGAQTSERPRFPARRDEIRQRGWVDDDAQFAADFERSLASELRRAPPGERAALEAERREGLAAELKRRATNRERAAAHPEVP
jgi:hypothetical protein